MTGGERDENPFIRCRMVPIDREDFTGHRGESYLFSFSFLRDNLWRVSAVPTGLTLSYESRRAGCCMGVSDYLELLLSYYLGDKTRRHPSGLGAPGLVLGGLKY